MLRYKLLISRALDPSAEHPLSMRELAQQFGFPVTTLYSYHKLGAIPRLDNMEKMADYFNETISSLYSEDDDTTAALVAHVRRLDQTQKQTLLATLTQPTKPNRHTPPHTQNKKTATQQKS